MKLSTYLNSANPTFPVRVVGNGHETSNIPLGTLGTVTEMVKNSYQIVWDGFPNCPEIFSVFGGMAMTLDIEGDEHGPS
jgi:hypothetical protein